MVTAAAPFTRATALAPETIGRVGDRAPGHVGLGKLDDRTLIAAISAGDAAALDQLYIRHRAVAFATAFALLRDPLAAEDAVHDAFLNVWRSASSFQPERGSPRAWFLTIVRNTAIDGLRARQLAQQRQAALTLSEITSRGEEDVSASVVKAADAHRLRTVLTALPPPQRHAIELAFFGGLSHGEIAKRTEVPLGTVKGRIRLGLRRLRHDLDRGTSAPSPHPHGPGEGVSPE